MLNFQTYERNDNDGVDMSSTHSFGSATYNTNQFWKREKKKRYFHPIPVVHLTVTKPIEWICVRFWADHE